MLASIYSLQIPDTVILQLFETIHTAKTFNAVKACVSDITLEGYPMGDLLMKMHDAVVQHADLSDIAKALICEKIAEVCAAGMLLFV